MTPKELEQRQEAFEAFYARFADLFKRRESRDQARKYLRGLLSQVERKNSWQVAEAVWDSRTFLEGPNSNPSPSQQRKLSWLTELSVRPQVGAAVWREAVI